MIVSRSARTLFDGDAIASTGYVYNSAGGSDSSAGWFSAKGDNYLIMYNCATLSATTLTYRIEGKWAGYTRPVNIYTGTVTSAMTIDNIITVTENVDELRLGVKVNNTATPNIFYAGAVIVEKK